MNDKKLIKRIKTATLEELKAMEWHMHNEVAVSARCSMKIYDETVAKRNAIMEQIKKLESK